MKVAVFTPEMREPIGIGELGYEDIPVVDDDDESVVLFVMKDHPRIVMEDGEVLRGLECWWIPI